MGRWWVGGGCIEWCLAGWWILSYVGKFLRDVGVGSIFSTGLQPALLSFSPPYRPASGVLREYHHVFLRAVEVGLIFRTGLLPALLFFSPPYRPATGILRAYH